MGSAERHKRLPCLTPPQYDCLKHEVEAGTRHAAKARGRGSQSLGRDRDEEGREMKLCKTHN